MLSPLEVFGRTWRRAGGAVLMLGLTAGCSLPAHKPAAPPPHATVSDILAYSDSTRALQSAALTQEIGRLNQADTPADRMRLALALSSTHQPNDLARAQDLLQRVLTNPGDDAQPFKALARLLAARFAEQRRLQDLLDRQNGQLRDLQNRLEQTQEKLDALKEIERSLNSRVPTVVSPVPPSRPASSPR